MSRLLCTCGKSYDVSSRAPGARVRCPACQSVLTVPGPRTMDLATRTASERLRRARGEPCAIHRKTLATAACERCQSWMCFECRAKPPSSHLCRSCAPTVGATEALPVDFGLLATPAIAARLAWRALPRVLPFNIVAHTLKWLIATPFIALTIAIARSINVYDVSKPEVILFIASYAFASIIVSLFEVVLIPAADILLFDGVLRSPEVTPALGAVLRAAAARASERKGALTLTFLLLLSAALGALVVLLPFVLAYQLAQNDEVIYAGLVLAIPTVGSVLGMFGLAIPAVVLEHRTAPAAFGRAYSLSRLRPLVSALFGTLFTLLGLIVFYRMIQLQQTLTKDLGPIVGFLVTLGVAFVADIAWPALLVAAYHGLVAEEARLVGRRS